MSPLGDKRISDKLKKYELQMYPFRDKYRVEKKNNILAGKR